MPPSPWVKKRGSDKPRAKSQQWYKLRKGLYRKAAKLCLECEVDTLVAVQTKTGQLYIFDSTEGSTWVDIFSNLDGCYPQPIQESLEDVFPGCLVAKKDA